MSHFWCHENIETAKERRLAPQQRDGSEVCFNSTSALVSERARKLRSFWEGRKVARHMPPMLDLFAGRMRAAIDLATVSFLVTRNHGVPA